MSSDHPQQSYYINYIDFYNDKPSLVYANGRKEWRFFGRRHRTTGPAVISEDGTKEWWFNGKLHRLEGPAIEKPNGDYEWYLHGNLHREDGPALENNECMEWWINGKRHREGDLPAKVVKLQHLPPDNIFMKYEWWLYNMRHRDSDEPAVIWSHGKMEWWFKGKRHRDNDKPAVIDPPINLSPYLNTVHFCESICNREWWYENKLHREYDKPALVIPDKKIFRWMVHGQCHRNYGLPAYIDEEKGITQWWFNGIKISKEHAEFLKKRNRKLVIKYQWKWKDYAYRFGSNSYFKRLEREMNEDMDALEHDIGYKFDLSK